MCILCMFTVPGLCRAVDHTCMNHAQVVSPLQPCAPLATVMCLVIQLMKTTPKSLRFKRGCNGNYRGSVFLLCVSAESAAERSCAQSGAPSPSQSTSSHALSSVKSKGSLRRQSKSVVESLLVFCPPTSHVCKRGEVCVCLADQLQQPL